MLARRCSPKSLIPREESRAFVARLLRTCFRYSRDIRIDLTDDGKFHNLVVYMVVSPDDVEEDFDISDLPYRFYWLSYNSGYLLKHRVQSVDNGTYHFKFELCL